MWSLKMFSGMCIFWNVLLWNGVNFDFFIIIRRRKVVADELFECVWPFFGIGAERVDIKNIL